MKKVIFTLATFCILVSNPSSADSIKHARADEIPAPSREIVRLDFKRYGDHLFGYATIKEAANRKRFLEIRFSNGTRTKYSFGVNIVCLNDNNGEVTASYFYERTAGHSAGFNPAVEKSGEFMLDCQGRTARFDWALSKKDIISIDDVVGLGKAVAISALTNSLKELYQ